MKKSKLIVGILGMLSLLLLVGCSAQKSNSAYYQRVKNPITKAPVAVNYPTSFDGFLKDGDVAITGTVKKVEPLEIESAPYTVASIKVDQVLKGDAIKKDETVKVVFFGGNLDKQTATSKNKNKKKGQNFLNVTTDEEIAKNTRTVEYPDSYLPEKGDKYGLVLTKNELAGFHGYKDIWEPLYGDKGIFKEINGKYVRKSSDKDKSSTTKENKMMNQAFTKLAKL